MEFLPLIIVGVGAWLVWRYFAKAAPPKNAQRTPRVSNPSHLAAIPEAPPIDGDVDEYEIVGESHYQRELTSLFGPKGDGIDKRCAAILVLEPANKHDKNAVRCEIAGLTVGYLARDDAKDFGKYMRKAKLLSIPVAANVRGGWKNRNGEGSYGVVIEVPAERVE